MKDKNNLFFLFGAVVLVIGIVLHLRGVSYGIHTALGGFILLCAGFFRLLSVPKPHIDMSKQPKLFHGDFGENPHAGLQGGCMGNCGSCMERGGCAALSGSAAPAPKKK